MKTTHMIFDGLDEMVDALNEITEYFKDGLLDNFDLWNELHDKHEIYFACIRKKMFFNSTEALFLYAEMFESKKTIMRKVEETIKRNKNKFVANSKDALEILNKHISLKNN
ncbi:MAG: hypothetical protein V1865_01500 [bacterium]